MIILNKKNTSCTANLQPVSCELTKSAIIIYCCTKEGHYTKLFD